MPANFIDLPGNQFIANSLSGTETHVSELSEIQKRQFEVVNERIKAAYPQKNWGMISSTAVLPDFLKSFNETLESENESVDHFVQHWITESGYQNIYVVHANPENLKGVSKEKCVNHSVTEIEKVKQNLRVLLDELPTLLAGVPEPIISEYRMLLMEQLVFCDVAVATGSQEFTQKSEAIHLEQLVDQDLLKQSQVMLEHEQLALAVLEQNKKTGPQFQYKNLADAIEAWDIQAEELAQIGITADHLAQTTLESAEIVAFFKFVLTKMGLNISVLVDDSATSISVNSLSDPMELKIPRTRRFSPDDLVFIPRHESWHLLRGHNGGLQPYRFFKTGFVDYLETEEGLAVMCEMVAGQRFGHQRQVKMAARYYAAAMSVKTERGDDGKISAMYSIQDIYDSLIDYKISPTDAKEIVLRLHRGTSLTRQVTPMTINGIDVNIPEVNLKDTVYFQGQMELFEQIMARLPLSDHDREKLSTWQVNDVSPRLLARVGRQVFLGTHQSEGSADRADTSYADIKKQYNYLVSLGKDALIKCLDYYALGKVRWQVLEDEQWKHLINRSPEAIPARKLFFPTE